MMYLESKCDSMIAGMFENVVGDTNQRIVFLFTPGNLQYYSLKCYGAIELK